MVQEFVMQVSAESERVEKWSAVAEDHLAIRGRHLGNIPPITMMAERFGQA